MDLLTTPWTADLVARRAIDFVQAQSAERAARVKYRRACEYFRDQKGLDRIDRDDPIFHLATRKFYGDLREAHKAVYNARRRLETAVRRLEAQR